MPSENDGNMWMSSSMVNVSPTMEVYNKTKRVLYWFRKQVSIKKKFKQCRTKRVSGAYRVLTCYITNPRINRLFCYM